MFLYLTSLEYIFMDFRFDTALISKYRTQLMGLAMLWIIMRHSDFNDTLYPFVVRLMKRSGYGGVDIFFFLSGLGIYFAYGKENIRIFFKKRFLRILPYYIPIVILFTTLFQYPTGMIGLKGVFLRIFLLDYWVEGDGLGWYIPVALLFYILTPFVMKLLGDGSGQRWIVVLVLVAVIGFLFDYLGYWWIMNTVVFRLASYVLGIHVGYLIANNQSVNIVWLIISFVIGAATYGLQYLYGHEGGDVARYLAVAPFFFLTFPICAVLSYVFSLIKNYKFPFLYFIGSYTLGIYIFHERVKILMKYYDIEYIVIGSAIITIVLAYLWQNLVSTILEKAGLLKTKTPS